MKTKIIFLLGLIALILNGCFVKSLHPFYKEKNVVFDEKLIGTWLDQDSAQWTISQHQYSKGFLSDDTVDNSYDIIFTEETGNKTKLHGHLFSLGGSLYIDFYLIDESDNDMFEIHIARTHTLAKIEIGKTLTIKWFNEEWIKRLFEENRIKIQHEKVNQYGSTEDSYILTASTEELQKFLLKYGNDKNAFKAIWEGNEKDKDKNAFVFILTRQNNIK